MISLLTQLFHSGAVCPNAVNAISVALVDKVNGIVLHADIVGVSLCQTLGIAAVLVGPVQIIMVRLTGIVIVAVFVGNPAVVAVSPAVSCRQRFRRSLRLCRRFCFRFILRLCVRFLSLSCLLLSSSMRLFFCWG